MIEYMLSTIDNPYNPFTMFDDWLAYDERQGYATLPYLARVTYQSNELSEIDQNSEYNRAIDEIVKLNINGRYIKVSNESN
jgi:uncharacterized lipoprotein YddW (UPF0748 family)